MSPARPAHEQPGAIPARVPFDEYGNLLPSTASVHLDRIEWRPSKPFTRALQLHDTHGLRGITRPITWKDPHGPATFPMFPDDLARTVKSTIIDHGLVIGATWVPLVRRDRYGIALKSFHEQEDAAPEAAPASPAEEAAARFIDREHAVRLVLATFAMGREEGLPPDLTNLIRHIRED
ncbi:hypothetical protein FAF44_02825 [Nonomuraea sp. MG754425]|uniref:hypothetical protein n=1 Tax=Nonomuraea sp. MG754425 TaxID=2570319 RepID=UPI001F2392D1|nr:hypothetical protein [Nonomuraea sp. MG754425]MCF6467348.1 hypothetical protein [Nonomuraea sp. MG754425]